MKRLFFILILITSVVVINAQETEKKSKKEIKAEKQAQLIKKTKTVVESKNFVFDVTSANPMKGRTVTLTTDYEITVKNDSVFSYMPYYGTAYIASYGSSESPMSFEQPVETYKMEITKSGYLVKVKVRNKSDVIDLSFNISETGSTLLSAISTNRQSINYFGNITEVEEKK